MVSTEFLNRCRHGDRFQPVGCWRQGNLGWHVMESTDDETGTQVLSDLLEFTY